MSLSKLHIRHLDSIDSTNDYIKELIKEGKINAPYVVYADYQNQGRGMRGNSWESANGQNLLCSIYMEKSLQSDNLILRCGAIALAIVSALSDFGIESRIKWPNDVVVGKDKICGILIENALMGEQVKYSIVGIGLNVNQTEFHTTGAISMKQVSGKSYQIEEVLASVLDSIKALDNHRDEEILHMINSSLYMRGELGQFYTEDSDLEGKIIRLNPDGTLKVFAKEQEIDLTHGLWRLKRDSA